MEFLTTWPVRMLPVAVILVACSACERAPTPLDLTDDQIGVYSVLEAGSDSAHVLVVRHPPDADPYEPDFEPVPGAEVHLLLPSGDSVRLRRSGAGAGACVDPGPLGLDTLVASGCYSANLVEPVTPGAAYDLMVKLPSGVTATGTAVVPETPEFVAPPSDARVRVVPGLDSDPNDLLVRWRRVDGTGYLKLLIVPRKPDCRVKPFSVAPGTIEERPARGSSSFDGSTVAFEDASVDSVAITALRVHCPDAAPFDSLPARLRLAAYDTAYGRFVEDVLQRGSVRAPQAGAGLTGATGVFAAVAIADRAITFVPE